MNYKDKFNAQMKKAGINSLDDLKTDAEKKAFFKAVDKSHDAKNEELLAFAEEAIKADKKMDKKMDKMERHIEELLALANKSKGGFWMGMTIASVAGGFLTWLLTHWNK